MFDNAEENWTEVDQTIDARAYIMGRNMFGPVRGEWIGSGTASGVTIRRSTPRSSCSPTTRAIRSRWTAAPPTTSSPTESSRHWPRRGRRPETGDVSIRGASTINQHLAAYLIDELRLHIVPFTLGAGDPAIRRCPAPESRAGGFAGSDLDHTRDLSRAVLNRTV